MTKSCRECGAAFEKKAKARMDGVFCCGKCRKSFNNRRMVRGALLYDLFMAQRYERAEATAEGLMTIQSNLARAFRDADQAKRAGRPSWDREAVKRLPLAYGRGGDGR